MGAAAALGLRLAGYHARARVLVGVLGMAAIVAMLVPQAERLPGGALPVYPGSALLLILAAIGIVDASSARKRAAASLLAAVSAALLFIALVGVSFRMLLALPPLVDISLPTIVCLLCLCYAVVALHPGAVLLDELASPRPGAVMTRRLLPAALVLPLAIGAAELAAEAAQILDSAVGSVLQTLLTMAALGALVVWGARWLDRLDRRRSDAEQEANAQREWLLVTISSCGEGVVATDPEGTVRLVNPAAQTLVGRASSELVGRPISEAFPVQPDASPGDHPMLAVLRGAADDGAGREAKLVLGGSERYVEVSVAPIASDDGALLGGVMIVRDVSLRHQNDQALRRAYAELDRRVAERTAALERANAALHESLALLRGVAESTPDLIVVKDGPGRVVMANPAHVKAIGKPEADIVGRTENEFMSEGAARARRNTTGE